MLAVERMARVRVAEKPRIETPKRVRRTRDEARELILDATEKRLEAGGPDGIRLQEIAADVGVSHPTILHHFGSREALVDAVVMRAMASIQREAAESVASSSFGEADAAALLGSIMKTIGERGHARVLAWLSLTGKGPEDPNQLLRAIASVMHARRLRESGKEVPFEDTLFILALSSLVLFGESIFGARTWESAGLGGDADVSARFHRWLVDLLGAHMHSFAGACAGRTAAVEAAPKKTARRVEEAPATRALETRPAIGKDRPKRRK